MRLKSSFTAADDQSWQMSGESPNEEYCTENYSITNSNLKRKKIEVNSGIHNLHFITTQKFNLSKWIQSQLQHLPTGEGLVRNPWCNVGESPSQIQIAHQG
jgi:hypothetical protein